MIVEDEGLIANDIALQLKNSGYSVDHIASSGEEALAHLNESRPDLVLMDIRLKGEMDGVDAAMRIRSAHRLPVIILTAHADSDTLARAKLVEPFGYLIKPFRQVNLSVAIEVALHKHRSESALMEREAWLWSVLQSTSNPTVVLDARGVVRFLNLGAEVMLQCEASELIGSDWTRVMPLVNQEGKVINDGLLLDASNLNRTKLPTGVMLRRTAGLDLLVEGEVSCVASKSAFGGAVVTVRDVSRRREQEAHLRQQQILLALGRLAGGAAHNFNNLLTGIIGHLSLLALEDVSNDQASRIEAALDAAKSAARITEHLLTATGSHAPDTGEIDVNARVDHLLGFFARSLEPGVVNAVDLGSATAS
jgi:DNA-binding response OmpR family regulator